MGAPTIEIETFLFVWFGCSLTPFTVTTVDYKIPHGDTRWFTVNVCKT